jgi:hypothetical protein
MRLLGDVSGRPREIVLSSAAAMAANTCARRDSQVQVGCLGLRPAVECAMCALTGEP